MIATIKHFFEGFFSTFGEKEKPVIKESNSTKECCKKAINNALSNKKNKDVFLNSPNKTIIVSAYCEKCNSTLNIAVNCNTNK